MQIAEIGTLTESCATYKSPALRILIGITLTAGLLVCLPSAGAAQKAECKYQENSVDKFTKKKKIWTKWNHTVSWFNKSKHPVNGYVSAIAEGDKTLLGIKIKFEWRSRRKPTKDGLDNTIVVPDGALLLITMVDESAVSLRSEGEIHGTSYYVKPYSGINHTSNYVIYSEATVRYPLDASALDGLTVQGATHVRMQEINRDFNFEIEQKSMGDIQHAIQCVQ